MPTGSVLDLWRWPVKSMAGERVRALSIGSCGVGGDRTHVVVGEHKGAPRPLSAREARGCWPGRPPTRPTPTRPWTPPIRRWRS